MQGGPEVEKKHRKKHHHHDQNSDSRHHHHRHHHHKADKASKKSESQVDIHAEAVPVIPKLRTDKIESKILALNEVEDKAIVSSSSGSEAKSAFVSIPLTDEPPVLPRDATIQTRTEKVRDWLAKYMPGFRLMHAFVFTPIEKYHHESNEHLLQRWQQLFAKIHPAMSDTKISPRRTLRFTPRNQLADTSVLPTPNMSETKADKRKLAL